MKVLFVTSQPNYCHKRFAESIGAEFYTIKHLFPKGIPALSLPINGLLNRSLPAADVYFAESIMDYYPIYYKKPKGKKILLLAEDTLTKLDSMQDFKKKYLLGMFRSCDGFLAISASYKKLVNTMFPGKPVEVVYPFPHKEFFHVKSRRNGHNVLFIGRDDTTKGFLQLVDAIKILREKDKRWNLYLIGGCSKSVKTEEGIHPLGYVKEMEPYLEKCSYFVHPAGRHSDYTTVATMFEAMNAGIIPVTSGGMGQAEIFRKNDLEKLILKDNRPETIAKKLEQLSKSNTASLSKKTRNLSKQFREKERLKIFRKSFERLTSKM